jgi:acyl-CoA thioesterase-2
MRPTELTRPVAAADAPTLAQLLELDRVEVDLFRSVTTFDDPQGLYGGQVMAQALRAASATVRPGFLAHSLHGYFVRPGDPNQAIVYRVHNDRDGRSYAARRVVALQSGDVLLNLSCSFHVREDGPDRQRGLSPDAPRPGEPGVQRVLTRAVGVEFRDAEPGSDLPSPTRVWVRPSDPFPDDDPNLHACMLTYVSDMCTGVFKLADFDWNVQLTSLDHALWLYRPPTPGWLLLDLAGESVAHGRAHYSGRIFDESGVLVAGLAQESLFRKIPHRRPHTIIRIPEET